MSERLSEDVKKTFWQSKIAKKEPKSTTETGIGAMIKDTKFQLDSRNKFRRSQQCSAVITFDNNVLVA